MAAVGDDPAPLPGPGQQPSDEYLAAEKPLPAGLPEPGQQPGGQPHSPVRAGLAAVSQPAEQRCRGSVAAAGTGTVERAGGVGESGRKAVVKPTAGGAGGPGGGADGSGRSEGEERRAAGEFAGSEIRRSSSGLGRAPAGGRGADVPRFGGRAGDHRTAHRHRGRSGGDPGSDRSDQAHCPDGGSERPVAAERANPPADAAAEKLPDPRSVPAVESGPADHPDGRWQ